MNPETQRRLIERILAHQSEGRHSTDTVAHTLTVASDTYASEHRLAAERQLFTHQPMVAGLSDLLPGPGTHAAIDVGDRPVLLTRDGDGRVAAMLNMCRHRGAQVATGCGSASLLSCPYHGWTYRLDGTAAARRRSEFFEDEPPTDLISLPAAEIDGIIWVCADPDGTIGDDPLRGAAVEIGPLDLGDHRLFDTTSFTRPLNWKIVIDTFTEAYHVAVLHEASLAPMIHSDFALFDAFGGHGRLVSARRSIDGLGDTDPGTWSLLPHATILWFLVPNTVLIYQQDHAQLYQARPGSHAAEAHIDVALYVPRDSKRSEDHWRKNFDLLVSVTDTEDFATGIGMQQGFSTGAMESVVFGRNEPALQHFHRSLDSLLAAD